MHLSSLLVAAVLPLAAIVGHLFGVPELYAFAPGVGTSLVGALLLLLLAIGRGRGHPRAGDRGAAGRAGIRGPS